MVSEILKEAYEILKEYHGSNPPEIKSIVRGQKFVGVQLSNMSIGLSLIEHEWKYDFPLFLKRSEESLPQTYELAKTAFEGTEISVCYGIACLNALTMDLYFNSGKYNLLMDMDVTDLWKDKIKPDDIIGMVGYMYPLADFFLPLCSEIILLDKHAMDEGKDPLPKKMTYIESSTGLKDVDILIATGSSLIYHSTEELIESTPNARLKAIIGPSVCLPPEPFWKRGVTYIGGSYVEVSYYQMLVKEDLRANWRAVAKTKADRAIKFGKKEGIRKLGLLK